MTAFNPVKRQIKQIQNSASISLRGCKNQGQRIYNFMEDLEGQLGNLRRSHVIRQPELGWFAKIDAPSKHSMHAISVFLLLQDPVITSTLGIPNVCFSGPISQGKKAENPIATPH